MNQFSTIPQWFPSNIEALNRRFEAEGPEALLRWATTMFGDDLVLSTGFGPSGIVIMHMLANIQPWARVFYLETDLLFTETLSLRDELSGRLGLRIEKIHSGLSLAEQANRFGPKLWQSEPDLCCELRKVNPLTDYLADKRGWMTGIRRDQSITRQHTQVVSWNQNHHLIKFAPLAAWSLDRVWNYIHKHSLPHNSLHDEGYPSIGCSTCTFKSSSTTDERAGRWAGIAKTECGIHQK